MLNIRIFMFNLNLLFINCFVLLILYIDEIFAWSLFEIIFGFFVRSSLFIAILRRDVLIGRGEGGCGCGGLFWGLVRYTNGA